MVISDFRGGQRKRSRSVTDRLALVGERKEVVPLSHHRPGPTGEDCKKGGKGLLAVRGGENYSTRAENWAMKRPVEIPTSRKPNTIDLGWIESYNTWDGTETKRVRVIGERMLLPTGASKEKSARRVGKIEKKTQEGGRERA